MLKNKKAEGGGKFILFLLVIIIIAIGIFWLFGDLIPATQNLHTRVTGWFNGTSTSIVSEPSKITNPGWCKTQIYNIDTINKENPLTQEILGWDSVEGACIVQYTGYSTCLHKEITIKYAYTAEIGGEVVYVKANDILLPTNNYKDYVDDLDREEILNKPCRVEYPQTV